MKRIFTLTLAGIMLLSVVGCGNANTDHEPANKNASSEVAVNKTIPTLVLSWGNEMHTGILNLPFAAPELFKDKDIRVNPVSESQGELIKDGETIAILNRVVTKGGSECATLMGQNHLDVAFTSSTAMLTAYDVDTKLKIHAPVQCDGVAIVSQADAEYNNFEEFVAYAKNAKQPVKAGYHSAISSPRIVLESALKEAGLVVTEDPAKFDADILMVDLKGVQNLVPSLTSKQVEIWAGPAPHPQTAEANKIGKIIATLNDLPEGKWENFPCCVLAARSEISEKYPEVMEALASITTDAANYANDNKESTAEILSGIIGVEKETLMLSNIVYTTVPDERFQNGIGVYFTAMTEMGKFNGKLSQKTYDEVKKEVFNFDAINKVLGK